MNITIEFAALDSADLDQLRKWRNDWRIWRWCRQEDLISDEAQREWFQRQHKDPQVRMYKVRCLTGGQTQTVGVAGLTSIEPLHRRAEFSLYIGPEFHGRGLGRAALKMLLAHGFQNLGLNQIWGETFGGNPAEKLFSSLGFKKDGTRRAFYFKDGSFHDAHLYSILRDEWIQTLLGPTTSLPESSSVAARDFSPTSPAA